MIYQATAKDGGDPIEFEATGIRAAKAHAKEIGADPKSVIERRIPFDECEWVQPMRLEMDDIQYSGSLMDAPRGTKITPLIEVTDMHSANSGIREKAVHIRRSADPMSMAPSTMYFSNSPVFALVDLLCRLKEFSK